MHVPVSVIILIVIFTKSECDDESLSKSQFIVPSNAAGHGIFKSIAQYLPRKKFNGSPGGLGRSYNNFPVKRKDPRYASYTVFPEINRRSDNAPESDLFMPQDRNDLKELFNHIGPGHGFIRLKRSEEKIVANEKHADHHVSMQTGEGLNINKKTSEAEQLKAATDEDNKDHVGTDLKDEKLAKEQSDSGKYHGNSENRNAQSAVVPDKINATANRRLIMAQDAIIEDYPYVVSIQKNNEHWCSGALITPRIVITTANCVWKSKRTSRMKVRVGSRRTESGGYLVGIQEVRKHPDWSIRKDPDCDVALLVLNTTIKFTDGLHAAELPNEYMMPPFNDAWVTSYGTERADGRYRPQRPPLHVYHARLIDRAKCNNVTKRYGVEVTENFICLAQTGMKAPCTRDTGAPAVSDGVVWGLASWGIRKSCGTERYPAVFSYLASKQNQEFIMNATSEIMMEIRQNPYIINK